MSVAVIYHYDCLFTWDLQQYFIFFSSSVLVLCIKFLYHCCHSSCFPLPDAHDDHLQYCPAITLAPPHLLCSISFCCITHLSVGILHHFQLSLLTIWPLKPPVAPHHSAPRSWHERDFCLMNLPTSRSRGYRGTRLDRKRLAREVMLSRWPSPLMSSALVPGGQGDWPRASRTAHSRSSGVRWSREAEISR